MTGTPTSAASVDPLLPERYRSRWRDPFEEPIYARLNPGAAVLDIGSGRHPAVPAERRPAEIEYVGLDLSREELVAAGPDAYTQAVAADATVLQAPLIDRFDLVISWQVLEHVRDLGQTVENIRLYLRPGGTFVALFSGTWSAFGLVNKVLPHKVGKRIVEPIMHRKEANTPVFPAYYDKCYASALDRIFGSWSEADIRPLYVGATYFSFARPLMRAYLLYENAIASRRVANLATHYLVTATR